MIYAYSNSVDGPRELEKALKPGWLERFRAIYIIHCECRHYFAVECEGIATVWRMGSIGQCREIQAELSCPRCGKHIETLWVYPISRLSRTPNKEEAYRMFDKISGGQSEIT